MLKLISLIMLQKIDKTPTKYKRKSLKKVSSSPGSNRRLIDHVEKLLSPIFGRSPNSSNQDSSNNKSNASSKNKSNVSSNKSNVSSNKSNESSNKSNDSSNKSNDSSNKSNESSNNKSSASSNISDEFKLKLDKSETSDVSCEIEEIKQNNRKRNRVYTFKNCFNSRQECDTHIRTISKYGYTIRHNNGLVNCGVCQHNYDKHKMVQMYWMCNCGEKSCSLGWKINSCEKSGEWLLSQTGDLHDDDYVVTTRVKGQKPKKRYGIALHVREIYEEWLGRNDIMTAHDLRCRLITKRKDNLKIPIEERKIKYTFDKNLIPSLSQVIISLFVFLLYEFIN